MLSEPFACRSQFAPLPPVREARLRPEFATLYPGIEPEVWLTVATLADHMIARLLREGSAHLALVPRVLDPAHYEFRGGEPPVGGRDSLGRRPKD